jgi:hypothetical protein
MKNWAEIQAFIQRHKMQYRVQRFNMSLGGALVCTVSGIAIAYTVKDAARLLIEEQGTIERVTSPAYRKAEKAGNRRIAAGNRY